MKKTMIKRLIGLVCIGLAFSASAATTWTYKKTGAGTSTAGTITNEQWTITVKSFDEENAILTLGNGSCAITARVDPEDTTQAGILDLRDIQVVKGDDTENSIGIKSLALSQSAFNTSKFGLKELYCNNISSLGSSCFANNTDLIKIEIGGPVEEFPTLLINKCSSLETAEFNFPNVKKAGDWQTITGGSLTALKNNFDVSTFVNPGITNILKNAFAISYFYGDLTLTNVMFLGTAAFQGASLTNVYLSGSLTTLPQYVLRGNGTITNVVLDLPNLETIDYEAFGHQNQGHNQNMIRRVELVYALKDMGLVTNIVRFAASGSANLGENGYMVYDETQKKNVWLLNNLCIYVSKKQWNPNDKKNEEVKWSEENPSGFVADVSTLKDKEKKLLDEKTLKNVMGVLITKSGTKTVRKAFIIHKPSIRDPKTGFAISIR